MKEPSALIRLRLAIREADGHVELERYLDEAVAEVRAQEQATRDQVDSMIEQFCRDLNAAHDELLGQQGVALADRANYDWPEWSGPANSIRWATRHLQKPLSKTALRVLGSVGCDGEHVGRDVGAVTKGAQRE